MELATQALLPALAKGKREAEGGPALLFSLTKTLVETSASGADRHGVLVSWGRHDRVPQTGELQQHRYILSVWRLEVQPQGAHRAGFS